MRIHNLSQLASYVGVPSCFQGDYDKAIARLLFKYTECGCVFDHDQDGVYVSGYAEGADAECERHYLEYPFDGSEWDEVVAMADEEGVEMWHEWNDGDFYDDNFEADCSERARDMNAALRGGW